MSDDSGTIADALRTLWMWLMIAPALAPLSEILEEAGFALGVSIPLWAGVALGVTAAGVLVGLGERRYQSVIVASFLAAIGWYALRYLLLSDLTHVYGAPRVLLAEFLLWLAALSLAVVVVFFSWRPAKRSVSDVE